MKILIAYDGSQGADDALDDLPRAGFPPLAEALIVSVAEVFCATHRTCRGRRAGALRLCARPGPRRLRPLRQRESERCRRALVCRRFFQVGRYVPKRLPIRPPGGVIKQADTWHPDLIVVGSHGRSALGRLVLGSVSQTIVTEARCSVRVARRHDRAGAAPARLVIGVDGSPNAQAAVDAMAARVWPPGSAVYVVAVLDTRLSTALCSDAAAARGVEWSEPCRDVRHGCTTWSKRWSSRCRLPAWPCLLMSKKVTPNVSFPILLPSGRPIVLVVRARGLSRMQRFLLGSVSAAVAARAHCSVEVIRPPYML